MKHALVHRQKPPRTRLRNTFRALLACVALSTASAQEPTDSAPPAVVADKEYFVRQQAGEVIVVRVEAHEAVFTSRLTTDDGAVSTHSGLVEARMLPIYQFVPETTAPRQIDIEVSATQVTDRTEFELLTTRLNVRDERSANLATAYRLLASGLEVLPQGNVPNWTVKVQTLMRAGQVFEEFGMREQGIWCSVYAAHLILHGLRDAQTARDWSEEILAVPKVERYEEILFAARKIRSSAMAASAYAAGGDPMNSPLQDALADTLQSARDLGYRFEEALALQASGVHLKQHGLHEAALARLGEALDIAVEIGASDLATGIREQIVELHGESGNPEAGGPVLQAIESQLVETGEDEELARNLLQQGRLFVDSHRYPEAIAVLTRSTGLEQSSLTRLQTQLTLGLALNEAGRSREALVHLESAATHPGSGDYRQPNPVLDLFSALGAIADIHRHLGALERMREVRAEQNRYATSGAERAAWAYARGIDALVQYGARAPLTFARLEEAFGQSQDTGTGSWHDLARLRLCALPAIPPGTDVRCSPNATRSAFEALRTAGSPRLAAEASLLYSRLLDLAGDPASALEVAGAQIETMGHSGTAVLGAWYWHWRSEVFENYLDLAIDSDTGGNASASLLALARARAVERGPAVKAPAATQAAMSAFRRALPRDAATLAFYLGDRKAHVWLADSGSVRRFEVAGADRMEALCAEIRSSAEAGDWDRFDDSSGRLGKALFEPLAQALPPTLFIVSQGALSGIPVDALSLEGGPVGTRHRVIHLDHFPPAAGSARRLEIGSPGRVFLAGDPADWTGEFAARLETSAEMQSMIERFVGPGLDTVQGVALLADEFTDERYADADIAHLALPGLVEIEPPGESRLFLSEPARGEGRQRLEAETLGLLPSSARLVFFSRTEFSGTGVALDNRLGVVSAVLEAGADSAIATLWPVAEEARSRIVSGFYDHLLKKGNVASALQAAKRDSMGRGNVPDWASFQLFVN